MNKSIMEFVAIKETPEFKVDQDKFFDYPLQAVVNGKQDTLYIQDVEREFTNDEHKLTVVCLHKGEKEDTIYTITKTCIAPKGCVIDWDNVHCATSFNVL